MPEWFLLLLGVAVLGLLGIDWPPLLWALPVAGFGAGLSVLVAFGYALAASRRARFGSRDRIRRTSLLALLFPLQPIARLVGRAERGLTPWRYRGPRAVAFPGIAT